MKYSYIVVKVRQQQHPSGVIFRRFIELMHSISFLISLEYTSYIVAKLPKELEYATTIRLHVSGKILSTNSSQSQSLYLINNINVI